MLPERVIAIALEESASPCLTCSFQIDGVVLLHMLRSVRPDIPVLFIDTVHHFDAIYAYRDRLASTWNLNVVNLVAREPAPGLWQTSTDACCARHKIEPLFTALESYDAWFTGLRRERSPSRATIEEVESFTLPSGKRLRKVSPLARWSNAEVADYARRHGIPALPLYDEGYTSIGCEPCTSIPTNPSNLRSGRWRGAKLECGIHVQPGSLLRPCK